MGAEVLLTTTRYPLPSAERSQSQAFYRYVSPEGTGHEDLRAHPLAPAARLSATRSRRPEGAAVVRLTRSCQPR
jgi:hypothetical protein